MIDFASLRVIWWILLGVLFMGFAITDGFDLGAATLFPWVARSENQKKVVLNSIGPVWEGNQVWIILGAGAIFAAWPYVYSVSFSGLYLPFLILLLTLGISRPVSFKYRNKIANPIWKKIWDIAVFIGGFVPSILFGVAIGNVIQGLPFYFDPMLHVHYTGGLFELFNPFALLCGLASLCMLCMHGGIYLTIKTQEPIADRAILATRFFASLLVILFLLGGFMIATQIVGYKIIAGVDMGGASNPLHKIVVPQMGAWMQNYALLPLSLIVPATGIFGAVFAMIFVKGKPKVAFVFSALSIMGVIGTVGVSMFPFILPSSTELSSSLLVWDSSSSYLTLTIMLISTVIFLPIVLFYTAWVYRVMRGKVTEESVVNETY